MNNPVLIIPNYLTKNECNEIIFEMNNCKFALTNEDWKNRIKRIDYKNKKTYNKITINVKKCMENYFNIKLSKHENLHTVVWQKGKSMSPHSDYGAHQEFKNREYVSLIYLNDDYEGGELFIPSINFELKPITGSLICFNGGKLLHGVKQIKNGVRYTSICWWNTTF